MAENGGAAAAPKQDTETMTRRLNVLYESWKENASGAWSSAACFAIVNGPPSEDFAYFKSDALQVWLLGYQLPDTIMVFFRETVHIIATAKRVAFLEGFQQACRDICKIELVLHTKPKKEEGKEQMEAVLKLVSAQDNIGVISAEQREGSFVKTWANMLATTGKPTVDITKGLADAMAVKDALAITNVKKAAYMSAMTISNHVVPKIEATIDEEKRVSHKQLGELTEAAMEKPQAIGVKLKAEALDVCYPPIFQSGGAFDLRPGAENNDKPLAAGVILVSLGARYSQYCSNIARTFIINASEEQMANYKLLLAAQGAAIEALKGGNKLSDVYKAAVNVVKDKKEALLANMTKNVGFGMGLEFKEASLSLTPRNEAAVVKPGMVFNVSVGFQDLESGGKDRRSYALLVADTVVIKSDGTPEVVTGMCSKQATDVCYEIKDEGEEEDQEIVAEGRNANRVLESKMRFEEEQSREDKRKASQQALEDKKNQETLARLLGKKSGEGEGAGSGADVKNADFCSYTSISDIPFSRSKGDLSIHVDIPQQTVLLPIYGHLVPFHINTIKTVASSQDSGHCYVRINFNVPGGSAAAASSYGPAIINPDAIFVRELSFRLADVRHGSLVVQQIKTLKRQISQHETEMKARESLVEQERLVLSKGRVPRLQDLWLRPNFGGRGKKVTGSLEAHVNGFRYSTPRAEERVDIMYHNIKHAFFQPAENEMITILHFHLHNPIMVGKKKTKDIQVYTEVMEAVQNIDGARRSAYDPDEIEEEQREVERRNRTNREYEVFVQRVSELWERDFKDAKLEFDIPFRELGFVGVPYRSTNLMLPTVNCLVHLVEMPFTVITLSEVEIVNLERVGFSNLKNFDMTFVFKDFSREVFRVNAIENKHLDPVKEWLTSCEIKYYETRMNLNWKPILKTIMDDPEHWHAEGGWRFLDENASDDEDEEEEGSDEYAPSDEDEDDDAEESSESESLVESDEDEDEDDDESQEGSEGKDWDELEQEAKEADEEASDDDDEEERRLKRKVQKAREAQDKRKAPPPSSRAPPPKKARR
eukprot:jgi/Mesvir1/24074/Mv10796-RA.1